MTEKEILRGNELILNFMSKDNKHIVVPDYGGTFIKNWPNMILLGTGL